MKNYLKQKLVPFTLVLTLLISVFSCSEEKPEFDNEANLKEKEMPVISEKIDFLNTRHYGEISLQINKINQKLDQKRNASESKSEEIIVSLEDILYSEYKNTHAYTFKIIRERPLAYIENLVLHYNNKSKIYDEYLVQYNISSEEFLELSKGGHLQSSKDVTIITLEEGFFNSNIASRPCEMVCETIYIECASGNHNSGNVGSWGNCVYGGTRKGPSAYQSCTSSCPTIDAGDSGGGGLGSGNGGTPGDDDVVTNPNPNDPCEENGSIGISGGDGCDTTIDAIERNNLVEALSSLTSSQIDWINSEADINVIEAINDYLDEGNFSNQDSLNEFALDVIEAVIDNPSNYSESNYPGDDDNLPFEWWLDDEFVEDNISFEIDDEGFGDLTKEEKLLVVAFPLQALIIKENKEPAENETQTRFGVNGRNDKSDAFRHAFFNAMNSNDAGDTVARLFSNAHETEVPVALILEVQMDLYNNNVGHNIGDDASIFVSDQVLSDSVFQNVLDGLLVYLSPLGSPGSPNNGITSSTQVIPTNQ